jgi:hypothetical protein
MYRRPTGQMVIEYVVFEGKLHAYNRWVKLSKIIPWEHIELDYADLLPCCQERGMALHTYEL